MMAIDDKDAEIAHLRARQKQLETALHLAAGYLALAANDGLMTSCGLRPARAHKYVMAVLDGATCDLQDIVDRAIAGRTEQDRLAGQARNLDARLKKMKLNIERAKRLAKTGDERQECSDQWYRIDRVQGRAYERVLRRERN